MNRRPLSFPSPLPWLAALALASAIPAQNPGLSARVVVDFAAGAASPAETIRALLGAEELRLEIQKAAGAGMPFQELRSFSPHELPGQCQVAFACSFEGGGELPTEVRDRVQEAVAQHLQQRLHDMLYREPLELLQHRRTELLEERERATRDCAELQAQVTDLDAVEHRLRARIDEVDQQRLAVQIDLATEQHANEFLERRSQELQKRCAALREQRGARNSERLAVEGEVRRINGLLMAKAKPPENASAEAQQLREQIEALNQRLSALQADLTRLDQDLADLQEALARTSEQLPPSTLALQRARARAEALDAAGKELKKQEAELQARRFVGARQTARLEQLRLDLDVGKQVLAELQQRLARLEPVRVRVIR